MKKILFMDHARHLGGGEKVLLTLLKNIPNDEYEIVVLVTGEGQFLDELKNYNIKYKIIKSSDNLLNVKRGRKITILNKIKLFFDMISYLFNITKYVKEQGFDIIYSNSMKAHICASIVSKLCKTKLVWRLHDIVGKENFNYFIRQIFIISAKVGPIKILPVSQAVKDSLLNLGVSEEKLSVIYNGVEIDFPESKKEYYHNYYNINDDKFIVGIVGWLIPWKGQEIFIKAAKEIIDKRKDVHFVIVGGTLKDSENYKIKLEELIKELSLTDYITFTGHQSDIKGIFTFIDLSIHCSTEPDPLPTVILESMMCGTPVIGVNLGGVPEMIEDKYNGVLYNINDIYILANEINQLIDNESERNYYIKNAKNILINKFGIEDYIKKHEDIFKEIL